jgi:Flp pilus assembly protein TadG
MMRRRRRARRGSVLLEFTLVGVPMMFVLISVFEISRGMWQYHTLAYAVKEATRYASVHGEDCSIAPNACTITIGNIATVIQQTGAGLIPADMTVTLTPAAGAATSDTLQNLLSSATHWPPASPAGTNAVGQPITISAVYPFRSALAMFWPGSKPESFGTVSFPASSTNRIQF